MCKKIVSFIAGILIATQVLASDFVIQNIRINGLQGISRETTLSYLPVSVGDNFSEASSKEVIDALYKTGFFSDIRLERQGNTLILFVKEWPIIEDISIVGNKKIETKQIQARLKQLDIVEGHTYSATALDTIKQELLAQYSAMGRYDAKVTLNMTVGKDQHAHVIINIYEGMVATVRSIKFLGNTHFSARKLRKGFVLSTPNLFSFITGDDQYTQQKLDADVETLRSFYFDHGYVDAKILSTQVSLTPDKRYVYITMRVKEGEQYHFSKFQFAGDLIYSEAELLALLPFHVGDAFSRKMIVDVDAAIKQFYGDHGYAFAEVNAIPTMDSATKQVAMSFHIQPGSRVYVHEVTISGNVKTSDVVLRRAIKTMEGSLSSASAVKISERNLRMLPYIREVTTKTTPVPGTLDQMDLDYAVQEQSAASATLTMGYSSQYRLLTAFSFSQPNILGSGKTFGFGLNHSSAADSYNFNYFNPYYTVTGIGQGVHLYYQKNKADAVNLAEYVVNFAGVDMDYTIPFSDIDTMELGYGFRHTDLDLVGGTHSEFIRSFLSQFKDYKAAFSQVLLNAGWTRNTEDRAFFPTEGMEQRFHISATVPKLVGSSVNYYRTQYHLHWYHPLDARRRFILKGRTNVGYGDGYSSLGRLPFYENFVAGGSDSVRGYETNTLGPREKHEPKKPVGGNALADASLGLIFPTSISPDSLRTAWFVDAGNVFNTKPQKHLETENTRLRYSTGVSFEWLIPHVGPLSFSFAQAIRPKPGDEESLFAFTFGTSF